MKRSRRRSAGSYAGSDVSYSDGEEYRARSGSGHAANRDTSEEKAKVELRKLKNREAARRVRERKSNQLNTYKSQVDELKRENQQLLQIIAQLQGASLGGGCLSAPVATNTTSTALADGEDGPAINSCLSAGVAPDSIDSGPSGTMMRSAAAAAGTVLPTGDQPVHQQQQQQQKGLASLASWPAAAATHHGHDANVSGSCALSQPANTCGMFSNSTMQVLSSWHSAPPQPVALMKGSCAQQQSEQVLLQRTCGCCGDDECEECEGVRITLSSASNLPLVTTRGPRPKPLTLEDLNLHGLSGGGASAQLHTGSLTSAQHARVSGSSLVAHNTHRGDNDHNHNHRTSSAAAGRRSLDASSGHVLRSQQQLSQQQQQQQGDNMPGSGHQQQQQHIMSGGMENDLVGTLEPSRPLGGMTRQEAHSSSGHAMFGAAPPAAAGTGDRPGSCTESCYVRKSSNTSSRSTRQQAGGGGDSAAEQQQDEVQHDQQQCAELATVLSLQTPGDTGMLSAAAEQAALQQQQQQQAGASFTCAPLHLLPAGAGASLHAEAQTTSVLGTFGSLQGAAKAAGVTNSSSMGPVSSSCVLAPHSAAAAADDSGMLAMMSGGLTAVAPVHDLMQQQQQSAHAGSHHTGKGSSSKPAHKLMRTIAAAVNGLVRPGRRNSGSSNGGSTPRESAAGLALQEQQLLAARSMSAHVLAPVSQQQDVGGDYHPAAAAGFAAAAAAGASAASVAAQQQTAMGGLYGAPVGGTADLMGLQRESMPLGASEALLRQQLSLNALSRDLASSYSRELQQQQQQERGKTGDDIILAAQLMLLQQQQRAAAAAGLTAVGGCSTMMMMAPQQQQQPQSGSNVGCLSASAQPVVAASGVQGGSSSRRPSAMDTTPIGCWPQDTQQQQQLLLQQRQGSMFGSMESLPAGAALLPIDFQATYTDNFLDGGGADDDDDDAMMELARQEGVLIDSDTDGMGLESFL